jgi:probable rRNA maturation factor
VPLLIEVLVDATVPSSVNDEELARAARRAAQSRRFDQGQIGIRVTDDPTIQEINRQHLQHDYPTDVISFAYDARPPAIEGELIISFDTARRRATELGWDVANELRLYVVHGVLHLTGMDDGHLELRQQMRRAEAAIMAELGVTEIERFGADAERIIDSSVDEPEPTQACPKSVTEQQT